MKQIEKSSYISTNLTEINQGIKDYIDEKNNNEVRDRFVYDGDAQSYKDLGNIFELISKRMPEMERNGINIEYRSLVENFNQIIISKIIERDFSGIINFGKKMLIEFAGIIDASDLNSEDPGDSILITEAINLAAKTRSEFFYTLKPAMIVASAKIGAKIGVEKEEGCWDIYYLFDKNSGVASFHDPSGEVEKLINILEGDVRVRNWEFGWSGIARQDVAYYLISAKEKLFMQRMRYKTLPGVDAASKRVLFDKIAEKYSI